MHPQAGDAPGVIKTDAVIVSKRVAFAGDHEVLIPVQSQFDRAAQLARGHTGPYRHMPGLGFFTTKAAAHAPALDFDGVVVNPQGVRYPVLYFAGVLGAGVHQVLVLLLGHHISHLAFKVEVLLPANFHGAVQGMRSAGQRG